MADWKSEKHLQDHYRAHRWELPGSALHEYAASAQATLDFGTYFEFFDADSGEWRTGCYARGISCLTMLDQNDLIVSHFRCPERYVKNLMDSTYE